jgi:prepilin-type processing-associated H-X9-DG protein
MYMNEFGGYLPISGYYVPDPTDTVDPPVGHPTTGMDNDWTTSLAGYLGRKDFVYDKTPARPNPDTNRKNKIPLYMCPLTGDAEVDRASNCWRAPRTYAITYYTSMLDTIPSIGRSKMVKGSRWKASEFLMFADIIASSTANSSAWPWYFGKFTDMSMVAFRHAKRGDKNESTGSYSVALYPSSFGFQYKPNGNANAVFLDGHAESLDWRAFARVNFSPTNAANAKRAGFSPSMVANPLP